MKSLRVATCQFSVEGEIAKNCRSILRLMEQAAKDNADVAHFPEAALSGYAGVDIPGIESIDWDDLTAATEEIQAAARKHKLWVLLGSTHRLTNGNKPHNSVYVIDARGKIVDRYDKRFCTGTNGRTATMDLSHYSPGNHHTTFQIKGITCGVLICYDYRFPELYREYCRRGVKILFQSFHNARTSVVADPKYNIWRTIVPATMACRAAENHFWISATNSQAKPSRWPAFAVRPDGAIVGRLTLHRAGALITDMPLDPSYFDAPGPWRERAMQGRLHSGELVEDARSMDRTCL